ncbi:MAG: peptide deformylase [Bacteroidetes bacterium 47-18]|nr:MAG: peptide deformylase [Bacteroidetes bacterium 47-18]
MIFPIVAYGHPVLRKVGTDIDAGYPQLEDIIKNMWETMYHTNGVGLAAPQVNLPIRLFVVDTVQIVEGFDEEDKRDYPDEKPVKKVFINAHIESLEGEEWKYNEGCLSIPRIREDISRASTVTMRYMDENFEEHTETFEGITARVILHEYDHIEGKLFIDYLSPLKKKLIKKKLEDISKGKVNIGYRMLFPKK